MSFVFPPPAPPAVAIVGRTERFPVHRIYCVGRNYAAHAREMGKDPEREAPFFFTKPADAIVANGAQLPFPSRTSDLHHEIELVVAIGRGGANIGISQALAHVFGYGVGIDLTRRDLQSEAKDKGRPWDTAKGFDRSAPISALTPAAAVRLDDSKIWLKVNGALRQQGAKRSPCGASFVTQRQAPVQCKKGGATHIMNKYPLTARAIAVQDVVTPPLVYGEYTSVVAPSPEPQ